jgi:hypothetical protein
MTRPANALEAIFTRNVLVKIPNDLGRDAASPPSPEPMGPRWLYR